jgi:hypothetical protein
MRLVLLVVIAFGRVAAAQTTPEQTPAVQTNPQKEPIVPAEPTPAPVPQCDASEAAELRVHLERERRLAKRWNTTWAITFGAAAVGSLALGYANPVPEMQDGLYVSAGKASIAALGRIILPLRIDVPAPTSDVCADLVALREAVRVAAKKERGNFIVNHVGGVLVNAVGAGIIWYRGSASQALISVAVGYPVGLLSNYLAPRNSWHLYRERTWTVGVMPQQNAWLVTVGGEL